jgi:putative membrane protein
MSMEALAAGAVVVVALLHVVIAGSELFLWRRPAVYGRLERFRFTQAEADRIAPIIANAGLYNGFIAAGLLWSALAGSNAYALRLFFLACVAIAGVYGAATLKRTTLFLQTLPALVAAFLVWKAHQAG